MAKPNYPRGGDKMVAAKAPKARSPKRAPKTAPRRTAGVPLPKRPPVGRGLVPPMPVDPYAQAITADQSRTSQQAQWAADVYKALASGLGGVGSQVQGIYRTAAADQSAFGKGYSDALQHAQNQGANQVNQTIATAGGPAGQMLNPGSNAADVFYGTQGAIPANNLTAQGAAFGSAASFLPAAAAGQGSQLVNKLLQDSLARQSDLSLKGAVYKQQNAIAAQSAKALKDYRDAQLRIQGIKARAQASKTLLPNSALSRGLGYLVDANGNPILNKKGKPIPFGQTSGGSGTGAYSSTLSQQLGYLVDSHGNPLMTADGKTIPFRASKTGGKGGKAGGGKKPYLVYIDGVAHMFNPNAPNGKQIGPPLGSGTSGSADGKVGGYTPVQIAGFKNDAADSAHDAYYGVYKDGVLVGGAVSYARAYKDLVAHGIPPWIAQQELDRYWTKPGYNVRRDKDGKPNGWTRNKWAGRPLRPYYNREHPYEPKAPKASAVAEPAAYWGKPVAGNPQIIGYPGQGTHSFTEGPNNWESDNALDIATPIGTPIYAIADGTIGSQIGSLGEGGRFAGLRLHLVTRGNEFYYAHLSRLMVRAGQRVRAGQLIGYSGEANGVAHLHIGARNGDPRNIFGYSNNVA